MPRLWGSSKATTAGQDYWASTSPEASPAGIGSANIGTQQKFPNNTFHFADNLTLIRGRHMFKTGGQLLRQQMNPFYAGNFGRTGSITFNGQYTAGPNASSPTSSGPG